jgi:hypothetical protein
MPDSPQEMAGLNDSTALGFLNYVPNDISFLSESLYLPPSKEEKFA